MALFDRQEPRQLTVDNLLVLNTAGALEMDEFEVFTLACEAWYGNTATFSDIDRVFAGYMRDGNIPHWVRSYCRNVVSFDVAKAASVYVQAEDRTGRVLRQLILGLCVVLSSIVILNTF